MTFQITPETFEKVPDRVYNGRIFTQGPAPFGLDKLEIGQSAFIPVDARERSAELAKVSTAKGCANLQSYVTAMNRNHRDLKGRKIAVRREGLGIRVYRLA